MKLRALGWIMVASLSCDSAPQTIGPSGGGPPVPTSTTLFVEVSDGPGGAGLPARLVLTGEDGEPVRIGMRDMFNGIDQDRGYCDLAPGAIGTWSGIILVDGSGEIPIGEDHCIPSPAIPFGVYRVAVLHGIEYEMFETMVDLREHRGRVVLKAPMVRAWRPEGALSADLHVHSLGSGDSNLPRPVRVASELSAGVQVLGASDHNLNGSLDGAIVELGVRGQIASLPSNEATTDLLHANVLPAVVDPAKAAAGAPSYAELRVLSAAQLFARLHALPGAPLVQLNHARLRYAAYFDYAGWDGESWPPPMPVDFDALEVMNGMQSFNAPGDARLERAVQDLYTLVDHGKLVTAVGNSDTHHLSRVLAGVPRNYVFMDDLALDPFDDAGFVDALRRRRVLVTSGPWLDVRAGGAATGEQTTVTGGRLALSIVLRQASYVHTARIRIWVGRELRETLAVPAGVDTFTWRGEVAVGPSDTWLGVDATGDDPLPEPFYGQFLMSENRGGLPPFAMINPILIDADGDGRYGPLAAKPLITPDLPPPPWDGHPTPPDCVPPR